jgi:3-oxoacyl-[acyl-carrier protein] reductase
MAWLDLQHYEQLKEADILINNVGGRGTWRSEDAGKTMWINYGVTKELTETFLKARKRKGGRVITIASIYGKEKGPNPYFTAAKSAQIAYMKSMAGKVKGYTFNTICPGHIDVGKKFPDKPKVIGKPEDVANLVVYLCSNKANHINGACITCDGGVSHGF